MGGQILGGTITGGQAAAREASGRGGGQVAEGKVQVEARGGDLADWIPLHLLPHCLPHCC